MGGGITQNFIYISNISREILLDIYHISHPCTKSMAVRQKYNFANCRDVYQNKKLLKQMKIVHRRIYVLEISRADTLRDKDRLPEKHICVFITFL